MAHVDLHMATSSSETSTKQVKHEDLVQFMNSFATEFNNHHLHDRVLVFEIIDQSADGEKETRNLPNSRKRKNVGKGRSYYKRKSPNTKPVDAKAIDVPEEKKEGENLELFVHSFWLAVHSTYFRALFYSGMKETHSKEVVMRIHEHELQAHLTLIEAMYKLDVLDDKDIALILEVLMLAHKYDVNLVFKKCKYVLISTPLSLEKCEQVLNSIDEMADCADVLVAAAEFLVKEFSPFDKTWTAAKFLTLSKASLNALLSSDKLVVQSENTVFVALMTWLDHHQEEATQDGRFFLSLVRFELMTTNFIYDIVRHDTLAKRLDGFHEFLLDGFAYHALPQSRIQQLKVKPIPRCPYSDKDPTFSWVIDQIQQELLLLFRPISSTFWFQGYQMELQLRYDATSKSYSMYLYVQNMKTEGHVIISWRAKSDLFGGKNICSKSTHTRSSQGFGNKCIESAIVPSVETNTLEHIIDVWVTIV